MTVRRRVTTRVNALAVSHMLRGIQDGCHTLYDLADMSGLQYQTVLHYCKVLHKQKVIHICDWNEDIRGGRTLRVYAMGADKDMPKPKPQSGKEICARYRAKKKQLELLQRMAGNAPTQTTRTHQEPGDQTLGHSNGTIQSTRRLEVAA